MNRYNKNPRGWHVFTGRDLRGFMDTVIIHGKDIWTIKEENINPYKNLGLSLKGELSSPFVEEGLHNFGYRPLPDELVEQMLRTDTDESAIGVSLNQVLQDEPRPIDKLGRGLVLQGPIVQSPKGLDLIPQRQKSLDLKLRLELNKLIARKAPHLRSVYG